MTLKEFPEIIFAVSKSSDGNMKYSQGDKKETLKNRQKFLARLGVSLDRVIDTNVQHGIEVLRVGKAELGKGAFEFDSALKVDALITDEKNIYLFLTIADCLPIAFYDPKNKAMGIVHAGWRGLDQGIIKQVIIKMRTEFGTNPEDLVIEIGPSIGPCCYKGFPDLQQKADPRWKQFISQDEDGFGLDLWGFARNELLEIGVKEKNINNSKTCTCHSGQYFSHRKVEVEKLKDDPRIAAVLGIKESRL